MLTTSVLTRYCLTKVLQAQTNNVGRGCCVRTTFTLTHGIQYVTYINKHPSSPLRLLSIHSCLYSTTAQKDKTMSVPDVQIFPHATGQAIKTVEAHQDPQELIFYAGWVRVDRCIA